MTAKTTDSQAAVWNTTGGNAWVEAQALLDRMFEPFIPLLIGDLPASTKRVLDVGCGTGAITLAAARQLDERGHCLGIDISEPMIAAARARAAAEHASAEFVCADAATYQYESGTFDLVVSRFGVMFFSDPVAAFTNLRRASAPHGTLRFAAWRAPEENPFMIAAEHAAAPLLPDLARRDNTAPGQFAFADRNQITRILRDSGWNSVGITPIDVPCAFPASALDYYLTRMGPVGRALAAANADVRARVVEQIRPAFDVFISGDEVRFTSACWLVVART